MRKVYLAFVWHMHQPMYRHPASSYYMMPWVRLHAVKDYLDMVQILDNYPRLKQTFNLVPSLLEQLEDYAQGIASDRYLVLSQIPVAELAEQEKEEILHNFFDLSWEQMVRPFSRYLELANKRSSGFRQSGDYAQVARSFSEQDFLDLTTWFNLAWIDPQLRQQYPELKALLDKGRDFSAEDRACVLRHHQRIVREVVPAYRKAVEAGQIEMTTTPYYHPILPLLSDTRNAYYSRPNTPTPRQQFGASEDARMQLDKAIHFFEKRFGVRPAGLWPSEQSLSPDILPLVAEAGIQWVASSEGILWHSLGADAHRNHEHVPALAHRLYRPYLLPGGVQAVFRDIYLSDLIGFDCYKGDNEHNAFLFYEQLKKIQGHLDGCEDFPYLITIALDGENCWEHYQDDGHHFLNALYTLLSNDESIESVTVSDYLKRFPPKDKLKRLHPGSWIRSDFSTWIGDPTKNYAWDLLKDTRNALIEGESKLSETDRERAWELLYTAEGSDWFWWFGEGNSSAHDHLFDEAFRTYLQAVYELLEQPIPESLLQPLEVQVHGHFQHMEHVGSAGTMQRSE